MTTKILRQFYDCFTMFCKLAPRCTVLILSTAAPWVEKVGKAVSCNFPTDTTNFWQNSDKFSTQKTMGTQNFNFGPKFLHNGAFYLYFAFLERKKEKKIFRQLSNSSKFGGKSNCPLAPQLAMVLLFINSVIQYIYWCQSKAHMWLFLFFQMIFYYWLINTDLVLPKFSL